MVVGNNTNKRKEKCLREVVKAFIRLEGKRLIFTLKNGAPLTDLLENMDRNSEDIEVSIQTNAKLSRSMRKEFLKNVENIFIKNNKLNMIEDSVIKSDGDRHMDFSVIYEDVVNGKKIIQKHIKVNLDLTF